MVAVQLLLMQLASWSSRYKVLLLLSSIVVFRWSSCYVKSSWSCHICGGGFEGGATARQVQQRPFVG